MRGAKFDGADLSGARIAADLSYASMRNARFKGADLSADIRSQSPGLIRAILRSADLRGADFENANLARDDLQFADFRGADLTRASLSRADASGADFRGAVLFHAELEGAEVDSARINATQEAAFSSAKDLARAIME